MTVTSTTRAGQLHQRISAPAARLARISASSTQPAATLAACMDSPSVLGDRNSTGRQGRRARCAATQRPRPKLPKALPRAKAMQHDDEKVDSSRRRGSASETTLAKLANHCVKCPGAATPLSRIRP
ncbi:hypothetical protein SVAN01_00391 [Stagonosporopsis vannaccii]|nr:hypothetical protein SVAN01_00391 [Stagonosporopsis vannaccii]